MTDTPDFDKMSPEEIMRWMESLAARQGATEGFTTAADMSVAEVAADDPRAQGVGEYIPFEYRNKPDEWRAKVAEEERLKAERRAAPPPAAPPAPPAPPPAAALPPAPAEPAAAAVGDTPDFDKMSPEEIMRWMESLAARQGATEGFTTAADMSVAEVAADDPRAQGVGEYIPFEYRNKPDEWRAKVAEEERLKAERRAAPPPAAPVAPPAPPVSPPQPPVAAALPDDLFPSMPALDEIDEDEEETVPAPATSNPMDWLAGLAGDSDDSLAALAGAGDLEDPLAALEGLAVGTPDDSMDWLAGLADDSRDSLDALADLANLAPADPLTTLGNLGGIPGDVIPAAPSENVNPIEWMETLAREQGADPSELTTEASLNIERPRAVQPDGLGYTPYSFESGGAGSSDETELAPVTDLSWLNTDDDDDVEVLDVDNPEDWLEQLATGVPKASSTPAEAMESFEVAAEADEAEPEDVMRQLNQGAEVTPEAIESMFDAFFKKAEAFADKDLEPLPEDEPEDEPSGAIEAEIPDWLREQMVQSQSPEAEAPAGDDKMAALLDSFEAEEAEPVEEAVVGEIPDWLETPADDEPVSVEAAAQAADLPDWLQSLGDDDGSSSETQFAMPADLPDWLQADGDSGEDISDIFVPESAVPAAEDEQPVATVETPIGEVEVDLSDPWVMALTQEAENEESLARWYREQTGEQSSDDMAQVVAAAAPAPTPAAAPVPAAPSADGLRAADLPVEADLPAGEPQAVPDWLLGDVMPAASEPMPDWLNVPAATPTSDVEMPDWLLESVTSDPDTTDLPDWITTEAAADEEIPDWLRDNLAEEPAPAVPVFTPSPPAPPAPSPTPAYTPPPASPVPVPVAARIDVAATLQSARSKAGSGDLDGSLQDYEAVIRANAGLDDVVKDLSQLVDKGQKKNPAVFRVMGDALMRRGNLQQALETYRKALNML